MALPTSETTWTYSPVEYGWPSLRVDNDEYYVDETTIDVLGQDVWTDGFASGTTSWS